jgi:hypothetical protein
MQQALENYTLYNDDAPKLNTLSDWMDANPGEMYHTVNGDTITVFCLQTGEEFKLTKDDAAMV